MAGTWRLDRRRDAAVVTVTPFRPPARDALEGPAAEAEDVGRFLGLATTLAVAGA